MQDVNVYPVELQMSYPALKPDLLAREVVGRMKERDRKQYNLSRYLKRQWGEKRALKMEFFDNMEYSFHWVEKSSDNERE